jgi:hypothetical protein
MSVENDEIMLDETVYWFMLQPRMADPETVSVMAREVLDLRDRVRGLEDQLRWRKWPEEKPEAGGKYLVIWFDDAKGLWLDDIKVVQCNEPLRECFFKLGYFYWRPIGPLPKESE